jgi:uncharacterized membrane protein YfcA
MISTANFVGVLVAGVASLAFYLLAVLRPTVRGRRANPMLILLFLAVPLSMAISFAVGYAFDPRIGELVLALVGWFATLYMLARLPTAVRHLTSRARTPEQTRPEQPAQVPRSWHWFVAIGAAFGFTIFAVDSLIEDGFSGSIVTSIVLAVPILIVGLFVGRSTLTRVDDWLVRKLFPAETDKSDLHP